MDDLHTRHVDSFNLFLATEALKGITEALYDMLAELPTSEPEYSDWHTSLSGLTWASMRIAREVHGFLYAASDRHRFPMKHEDIETKRKRMKS